MGSVPIWTDPGMEGLELFFSTVKFEATAKKLLTGKAPGSDGVFNEVLSMLIRYNPAPLLNVYSLCLRGSS